MFFPLKEFPTAALEAALAELGVVCRPLPEVDLPRSNATDTETDLSGFTMKVAALLLSRFQEVSCLDPLSHSLPGHCSPFTCSSPFTFILPGPNWAVTSLGTALLQAWGPQLTVSWTCLKSCRTHHAKWSTAFNATCFMCSATRSVRPVMQPCSMQLHELGKLTICCPEAFQAVLQNT